ncbi:hypothetical protein CPB84DRAFT_1818567 [Gymnopilus junonius]|uniref:protein-histidine N-methyltransferase n=1 Tax=Gymnopilus junonius TaxID=109634 RepID=A0A9P5N7F4_GYMJU|nr:hypothetical protein CPB84DRAFT_1818567 [Gymnopilus junonius]
MFKFDFNVEELDDTEDFLQLGMESTTTVEVENDPKTEVPPTQLEPFFEVSLSQLVPTTLVRRDLFDARFQLISEGAGDTVDDTTHGDSKTGTLLEDLDSGRQALAFLDAPSDLVPGVYEGGLKTWEETSSFYPYVGKKILEVGCGTGVPSIYIFRELLSSISSPEIPASKTEVHLQDYNASVLQLVTLPNIFLTWYTSHHADTYRSSINDTEIAPTISFTDPGELPITPELKAAFLHSIESLNISLRFFSGSWNTFKPLDTIGSAGYDIVLTSETIYRTENLNPLIELLQTACISEPHSTLAKLVSSQLKLEDTTAENNLDHDYLCLVAAKVLYFGVGGGVSDFLKLVQGRKGETSTVLERNSGVGRLIILIRWG